MSDGRIVCRVVADERVEPLPRAIAASLYRAAQEAVTNAAKHSGAGRMTIALARHEDGVALVVEDDGDGWAAAGQGGASGFGLRGMAERAETLGGAFVAGPGAMGGLRIELKLPASPLEAAS